MPELTDDMFETICQRIECGESVAKITQDETLCSEREFYRSLAKSEERSQRYARAKTTQMDYYGERIIEIMDAPLEYYETKFGRQVDPAEIAHRKNKTEAMRWLMGKLKPNKYGEKQTIKHEGETLEQMIMGARKILDDEAKS